MKFLERFAKTFERLMKYSERFTKTFERFMKSTKRFVKTFERFMIIISDRNRQVVYENVYCLNLAFVA